MLMELVYGGFLILALASALMVVLSPHAVYSALYLVVTMVSIAGLFLLMNAPLAAMFQVIVYAGAIMVLFLFVIMLLNVGRQGALPLHTRHIRCAGFALAVAFALQMAAALARPVASDATPRNAEAISIREVARLLITDYLYVFEITSVLLLAAVIGAIVLARRHPIQGMGE